MSTLGVITCKSTSSDCCVKFAINITISFLCVDHMPVTITEKRDLLWLHGRSVFVTFITARNEVRQGYIFTGVCHSVRRGGLVRGGVSNLFGGYPIFWGSPIIRGGFRYFFFNIFPQRRDSAGINQLPPETLNVNGRYASYWNAYLW